MKTTRDYIENAIYIVLIMSIMTLLLKPGILVCLFFSDLLLLFVLLLYTNSRNQLFYRKIWLMAVAAWGGIIAAKLITGRRIRLFTKEEFFFFCILLIELLSCNLNEVEYILISEIEKVFKRNGIFPDDSYAIKHVLGKSKWTELLGRVFFRDMAGMAVSFENYRKAFKKLDKKIILIFEDIDRITETNTIKKIFAIAEKIASDTLHVIFQFDCDEMEELGGERRYLEKYIPLRIAGI